MTTTARITLLSLAVLAACSPDPATTVTGETTTATDTEDSTDTPPPATSGTTGEITPTTGDEPTPPDVGGSEAQCDPWLQDCPDGYKCMAFAPEGENFFTGNKCVPVAEDPATIGDPCSVVDGWWTGFDDCDHGLACWDINHADNTGVCRALCTGNADAPACPQAENVCAFWVPGIAHVCLETCDPLIQDCEVGSTCGPEWSSNAGEWVCLAEYSGPEGQEFDPCAASNACDPGLLCWDTSKATECAGLEVGCCLSLCDLGAPACNGQGAECTAFYDVIDGEPPPEFVDVGLCVLPG